MTGPLPVDIGIQLVVCAVAFALVVSADTILCAEGIAEPHFARFHARGRLAAGVARRQSPLKSDLWDDVLLAASEGLARVQLRVYDDA